jgi:hypothetical protein
MWRRRGPIAVAVAFVVVALASCTSTRQEAMDAPEPAPLEASVDDVLIATATPGRMGSSTVLTSDTTQQARVTVPDAALPEGLSGDEITATVLSMDSPADGVAGITFDLGPDGATFTEPVLLEWEGPWSASATLRLEATKGDGTPIPDTGSTEANSIAALRVEPTSPTTARYTLPVDHFSYWSVVVIMPFTTGSGSSILSMLADASLPREVTVGRRETAGVWTVLDTPDTSHVSCIHGYLTEVSGPAVAAFPPAAACEFGEGSTRARMVSMSFSCNGPGAASVRASLYVFVTAALPTNPSERDLRVRMLQSANDLRRHVYVQAVTSAGAAVQSAIGDAGVLVLAPVVLNTTCVDDPAAVTSTTAATTTSSPLVSVPAVDPAPTTATTVRPTGSTTTTVRPTGSTIAVASTTTTGVTTSTTSASATTSSTAAPGTTTTSTAGAATSTSSSSTTSTTMGSTGTTSGPATTVWGEPGTWAYNEMGSCNWNDTGGCGWYYSDTPGTYVLGPIGSAGARYP